MGAGTTAAALLLATASTLPAQHPAASDRTTLPPVNVAIAHRASIAPAIDGSNLDVVWRDAPVISDFRQFAPTEGKDPSFRTEFQVAYDERNLYVFVRMYDPHPDSIMRALTRRDVRGPSDQIKVLIDSYNDGRTGYEFVVNPDGVKRDFAMFDDGNEDISWNGIWDVATTIDSIGWTAEFRIPLSQLRYAAAESHTFGFGIWRDIERYKERVSWPAYSPVRSGLVSQLGRLGGITGISTARRFEATPYTVTKNVSQPRADGGFNRSQQLAFGGDLKFGITPNVTVDATVNPDFGQVEADPAVLNLSAFETFLSERRPFFVEGTGLYQFRLNCYIVVDCSTNEGLFYSRRIGRSPQLRRTYGDATTATATPIAGAMKLTGRTGRGLSFGLLDAVTQHVEGSEGRTAEPRTNYAVLRAAQDLRGGESGISIIGTAVNRALDEWTRPYLHEGAYAAGASFRHRFGNRQYELAGSFTASHVTGSQEAIALTQQNAVHYYQIPGDDLAYDSTRTSLSGHAEQLKFGRYGGGIFRFETSLVRQSGGFDVNDLGYLRRADLQNWSTWASLRWNQPTSVYQWMQINGNHWQSWTTSGRRTENAWNMNAHMGLNNNWNLHAGGTVSNFGETFCDRCTRGGPALRVSRSFTPWFGVNGDDRMKIVPSMWVNLGAMDEGNSHYSSLSPSLTFRLASPLQATLSAGIYRETADRQWFGNVTDDDGVTHYTFATLEQRQLSMSLRVNYTARPNLTFEFYGQPFMATGEYSDFREISGTPDAPRHDDRFTPFMPSPDAETAFNIKQLRTNSVLRWEYLPGSTLFLVWSHGRQGSDAFHPGQSWRAGYREMFTLRPDNTFLIKVAYWLNR